MSKVRFNSVIVLCAALAACSDSATRAVTAPNARPSLSEASAEPGASYTIDGLSDLELATDEAAAPLAQMAGAQLLGAQIGAPSNAASGSRAMGHVGVTFPANPGIVAEKYSFTALRTDLATPLLAKGQYELAYTTGTGIEIKIHGDVDCIATFPGTPPFGGNTARMSGPITKVWRNNVPSPITANTHALWVVVDSGEGQSNPEFVSLMRFGPAAIAQNFCANGFGIGVVVNQEGNVQVQQ